MLKDRAPGNIQNMKRLNREAILQCLWEKGQVSRAHLAKLTLLSKPGVSAIVSELLHEGWIKETGEGISSGGRKPIMLQINADQFFIMAAIFEGTRLELALTDLNGKVMSEKNIHIGQNLAGQELFNHIEEYINSFIQESRLEKERVLGIGVGLPGITRRDSGKISFSPSTGWHDWPIKEELERRFILPVMVDNDVNLTTLGEFYKGAGMGAENLVYIHVGTGIGAGIILNGQMYRGFADASGEIGYMMIGRPEARFGNTYGTFEANYSTMSLYNRVKKLPNLTYLASESTMNIIAKLVQEAEDNEDARILIEEVCLSWTYGIANIVSVLNPELVILGGDMRYIGTWGENFIRTNLSKFVPVVPEIRFAELGERAGILGAVFQVLQSDRSLSGSLRNTVK